MKTGISDSGLNLTHDRFRQLRVPLAPLAEQRRIVAEIEKQFTRLETAVAALQRVQANLKRYRAAVLKAAVEGRLVPTEAELARAEGRSYEPASGLLERILTERQAVWDARSQARSRALGEPRSQRGGSKGEELATQDQSDLPTPPEGWLWTNLSSLIREPLRNGHSAKSTNGESGVPTFSLSAVTYGDFSSANIKMTSADPEKVADLWVEENDIFIERSNTPELVGTARRYTGPPRVAIFPDLLIRVRVVSSVLPAYVELALQSARCRDFFRRRAQGISGTMPKIDQSIVQQAMIPLPPLAEQHRILSEAERRFSFIDELEMQVEANLKRAERLRQAILKRAFEGKLVPQDPDDEPASVLLERIRGERKVRQVVEAVMEKARKGKRARAVAAAED
ncbi:MAG: hypothetical protein L0387_44555 [Acidobacteria bacterium]|nr:hypothetical protein [Acidobacteriota bacterium]